MTSTWKYDRLRQRRDWLEERQKAKAAIGWDNLYDVQERDALTWALVEIERAGQARVFLRFLLDDVEHPADMPGLASRIRNDVPRLLRADDDVVIG